MKSLGYVTHGTDRPLWAFRSPILEPSQINVARQWLTTISQEVEALEKQGPNGRSPKESLTLKADRSISWEEDERWDEIMRLRLVLSGEEQ